MKKVAIYRGSLLPPSETFIKEQALALRDWKPVLIGYRTVDNGLDLSGLDVRILPGMTAGRMERWRTKLRQWRSKPHAPTVRALRELGVGLVHAHFGTDATDIWPSVNAAGLRMLVTLHGYDINIHREWWESGKGGLRRRNYPRLLLALAREPTVRFVAVSEAIRERAIEYGIPGRKIVVRYIGIDTDRFKPGGVPVSQRGKRILFVGRMVEKKSPLLMVRAYADVLKHHPDAELHMAGGGALLPDAQALAHRLNVPVKFLGSVNAATVQHEINEATVLCLPSVATPRGDAEGFGLVLLEAQASGVPVVTSALGGALEGVINGETGLAFPPGDRLALVQAITTILSHPGESETMSKAAVTFVRENFNIRKLAQCLENTYDDALHPAGI